MHYTRRVDASRGLTRVSRFNLDRVHLLFDLMASPPMSTTPTPERASVEQTKARKENDDTEDQDGQPQNSQNAIGLVRLSG